ncbi:MAG: hypothetical protein E5X01_09030, partial [Mesorhizobium sp.]
MEKAAIRPSSIDASIEMAPSQVIDSPDLPGLFPSGVRVYITDIGLADTPTLVKAARRGADLGYTAVPHMAARRLTTRQALETRVKALAEEAGVRDLLIIGGDVATPAGSFSSSFEVLETGFVDKYGITEIGVAGHPEGSRDFGDEAAIAALRMKSRLGRADRGKDACRHPIWLRRGQVHRLGGRPGGFRGGPTDPSWRG